MNQKNYLKTTFIDTAEIFIDELKNIFKDTGVVLIFFAAGILYPILYGSLYRNEVLRDIPMAVINQCPSSLARELVRKIDATPELKVAFRVHSMEEAKKLYGKNEVRGILFIPSNFSKNIQEGKQAQVFAYSNVATLLYYRGVFSGINYVCLNMNKNIQVTNLKAKGLTNHQAEVSAMPIKSEDHALYNPYSGFASFLLPAVLILILQQTLVLGIGMLAGTARENNTYHQLIPYQRKYHGTIRILGGKGLAYLLIYTILGLYNLILIPHLFNLPHFLTLGAVLPFLLPFLLACIFFGMAISIFFWDRESALLIYLCTSLPVLLLSGFSWPNTNIHPFWTTISYFFPSTFGIQGFLKMNSMGANLSQIGFECMGLWIQTGVYFIFAFFVYRWQIIQSEKKIIR